MASSSSVVQVSSSSGSAEEAAAAAVAAAAAASSTSSPCAACKFLRRKCQPDCVFAPYFPPDQPQKFVHVHRVFGASNVTKLLNELHPLQREDAVNSLAYEADMRLFDPVYGCVRVISILQHQLHQLQIDLSRAKSELSKYQSAAAVAPHPSFLDHQAGLPFVGALTGFEFGRDIPQSAGHGISRRQIMMPRNHHTDADLLSASLSATTANGEYHAGLLPDMSAAAASPAAIGLFGVRQYSRQSAGGGGDEQSSVGSL
ncbi:LOB domain-containing protein 6-like [Zingiber officinale]|uniref:LOB domain-containing protein 6-like n=1 Tax=Zingiber officinale TaxID=94328 RepID=UPI001C4B3286|nr:LOB domain-containing protein 6-like [Zingiber officinale]